MTIERKYLILAVFASLIVALDQMTKIYIHANFELGEYVTVIPDYFNITYVRNLGAAFGFLANAPEAFRNGFFLAMPPIAMITIFLILRTVDNSDRIQILALSSIFGGAIGNYIDRLRFGFVVDFLDFHWQNKYAWPAFNVADSAIVVGVFILLWLMRKQPEPRK